MHRGRNQLTLWRRVVPIMTKFDAKTEAWLTRLMEKAPPLSPRQQDLIAGVFRRAFTAKAEATPASETPLSDFATGPAL